MYLNIYNNNINIKKIIHYSWFFKFLFGSKVILIKFFENFNITKNISIVFWITWELYKIKCNNNLIFKY